jgi:PAS domain S-box-containing protein
MQTDMADSNLVAMENEAFSLVRQGRREEAAGVLFSAAYEAQKRAYAEDIQRLLSSMQDSMALQLSRSQRRFLFAASLTGFSLLKILGVWFGVAQLMKRHLAGRQQTEDTLHEAQLALELRVQERTSVLLDTITALQQQVMERSRAEKALRQAEARYRSIFENTIEGIFQTTLDGQYLEVNAALAHIYGYAAPEELMQELKDIGGQLYVTAGRREEFRQLLHTNDVVTGFESEIYRKDGNVIWIAENARAVRNARGELLYYEGTVVDITVRRRAEEMLRRSHKELEQRVQERTAALATTNASLQHELAKRERIETALRESHERFTSILGSLDEIVWSAPADSSSPSYFNPMTEKVYGRAVSEFLANPQLWREVVHPEDSSLIEHFTAQVFSLGAYSQEYRIIRPDGSVRWLYHRARLIRDKNGHILRIDNAATDVTARRLAEVQLREEKERYRQIIDSAYDLIVCFNSEGIYTSVNRSHEEILGWTPEELIGQHFSLICTPAAVAITEERQRRFRAGEQVPPFYEVEVRHKDGRTIWLEGRTRLIRDTKGQSVELMGIYRDITVRKRTEEALQLRDRAMGATTEGITISDPSLPDHPLIYANSGFERLTGNTTKEVLGRNCRFLQGPDTDRVAVEGIRAALRDKRECTVEFLNYRKDGSPFWNRLSITPVHDGRGRVSHFIGVQSDITQRKEVEQLKNDLVATVSHELRTPLTSLRGFAELMLQRDFSIPKQRQFLSIIHNEAVRLTALINDFLDIQRIESGRQTYDFAYTELAPLLEETLAVFTRSESAHTLHTAILETMVLASIDVDRIRQVLTNLLSNAIKYSPQGGEITLGMRREGDEVVVWVSDQGMGIPSEVIPRLFNKFFRVDCKETRSINGTGLGLALVKAIIDAHGGRVWVESTLGVGSTFFFTLPIASVQVDTKAQFALQTQDVTLL